MFIEKIENLYVDIEQMVSDYETVLPLALPNGWDFEALAHNRQINLRGADLITSFNSETANLKDFENLVKLFSFWNEQTPKYTSNIVDELSEKCGHRLIRARYMCLPPGKGLTFHKDPGIRYHFVIDTNPQSLFFHVTEGDNFHENLIPYHLNRISSFYRVDTTQTHFVYNAGLTNRIHLVIS